MTAINANSTGVAPGSPAMVAKIESTAEPTSRAPQARDISAQRIGFRPSGTLLSPTAAVRVVTGIAGRRGVHCTVAGARMAVARCDCSHCGRWSRVMTHLRCGLRAKNSCRSCCPRKKGFAGAKGRASRFRLRSRALGAADCTAKCRSRSWRRREKAKPPFRVKNILNV